MTAGSSSDPRDRRGRLASGATLPGSFEELLEEVFSALHRGTDPQAGIRKALLLAAAYFAAERAVVRVPGCPPAAMEGSPAVAPDLQEEIELGRDREVGTVALFGSARSGSWTDRDARQLRIVGRAVCEALCRQRAESELREQQIWLVMAMESASVGVWDWDLEKDSVRFLSPAGEHGAGLRVQETRASEEDQWSHPDDLQAASVDVERAISGAAETFSRVVRQRFRSDPDGRWHHLYSRGRVIERDGAGRAVRIMGTYEDVTEAYEKDLAEKAREAVMARAARMASLGVLASSLAHDLNQPLTALTSYLEATIRLLARGQATEADVVAALERSVSFAHRASEIVGSFRQLLQREAPVRDDVDLGPLLLRVRDRVHREAGAAEVEIEVRELHEATVVQAEELQIEQVVINLVRNAVEAFAGTSRRPRTVTLDVRTPAGLAEIRVADNGPGIPVGIRGRLFEPLTTTREAGRGLGLAICRSIAEIHGGRLEVESTGPDGTTFVLALPSEDGGGP